MKIPPKRVPSDDCTVYVGREVKEGQIKKPGDPYRVHEGEWVEILPLDSVRQSLSLIKIMEASAAESVVATGAALEELCQELSKRVYDWNWTDIDGELLPKPYKNIDAIEQLTEDELLWLILAIQGETPGERKNA